VEDHAERVDRLADLLERRRAEAARLAVGLLETRGAGSSAAFPTTCT